MVVPSKQPLLGEFRAVAVWIRQDAKVKMTTSGALSRPNAKVVPLILLAMLFIIFYYFNEDLMPLSELQIKFRANAFRGKSPGAGGSCRIPSVDPFHPSIMKYMKPQTPIRCDNKPLTKAAYDPKMDLYTLEIIENALKTYKLSKNQRKSLSCCYYPLTPTNKNDGNYKKMKKTCTKFQSNTTLSYQPEMVQIDCTVESRKKRKSIYQDVHSTATKRQKLSHKATPRNQSQDAFNVLVVGIDSVSYANFQRQMPATLQLLRNTSWIEYKGYNKVGDNTLPNLMPILTGHSLPQIEKTCWHGRSDYFDSCPFIWKNFSAHNYATMYAEDEYKISSFNFVKKGFKKPPVDYYARAYMHSATAALKAKMINGLHYCLGPTTSVDRVLGYSLDFLRQMNDTRFFGLVWVNSMTHNSLQTAHAMDAIMVDYFFALSELGVLDNTFVVFLSDHGIRFGQFRQTFFGWFEERLPFLFFHVPARFRELYPEQVQNLEENADMLTSPYEVHVTLHKVLDPTADVTPVGCPKCRGLFDPVDGNRSCDDAGIPFDWCVCGEFIPQSTKGPEAVSVGRELVNEINRLTYNKSASADRVCAKFKMTEVTSARRITNSANKSDVALQIIVKTTPGRAVFEATVGYSPEIKVLGSISRLDSYGSEGDCVDTAWMRKYCYCVPKGS
nr:PREDICTED: uncharacterized protein LOC109041306 isoform X1 [Bemisia tabaci]